MDEQNIYPIIRDNLYNYKYLLKEYDYSVFVETVIEEIKKQLDNEH